MKKSKYFFTLVGLTSVFFIVFFAFFIGKASAADFIVFSSKKADGVRSSVVYPWDIAVKLRYGNRDYVYRLADNVSGFSSDETSKRVVYRSPETKGRWVSENEAKGLTRGQCVCYVLPGFKNFVDEICDEVNSAAVDAKITFNPDGKEKFAYTAEKEGVRVDVEKIYDEVVRGFYEAKNVISMKLPTENVLPDLSLAEALNSTEKRSEFETDCGGSTKKRKNNIALALNFFNGKIVKDGERVSFNATVGKRTADRGFEIAKVLVNGKYVDGVGGGVCQASTTLYNALLLGGVTVKTVCQHSLRSSYVMPSFDAMVSDAGADLVFLNDTGSDIYIAAGVKNGVARVEIYGIKKEYQVVRRSEITEIVPFKTKTVIDDGSYSHLVTFKDQTVVVSEGKTGLKSQGWLDYYENGKKVRSRLIRTNEYAATDRLMVTGSKERE